MADIFDGSLEICPDLAKEGNPLGSSGFWEATQDFGSTYHSCRLEDRTRLRGLVLERILIQVTTSKAAKA